MRYGFIIPGRDPRTVAGELAREVEEAGITWWIEPMWSEHNEPDDLRERIRQGPPSGG